MKLLIVGTWRWVQYEDAFSKGLEGNGVEVSRFSTSSYFSGWFGSLQLRLPLPGWALLGLNRDLIRQSEQERPDWILFWRSTHVLPSTLRKLRRLGIKTVSYNNDDPLGPKAHGRLPWHHHWLWFWYLRCLPEFDCNFFYRKINCREALVEHGVRHAEVLMPYFIPQQDRPVDLTLQDQERFSTDLVFVGHYEPDGRERTIRSLIDAGIEVKIWSGGDWPRHALGHLYDRLKPIEPALGDNYAKALCGAKICLAFLSKLNRDTYTRRCFEIPACGRLMLAERTDDLMCMFREDEEACFFSSNDELIEKVRWLLANPSIREYIAAAGLRRVWADGHDVNSRAKQFLKAITNEH
ncbi:CgeB family protein [Cylindrospermopsis curvispora]|uniref:Glycosyltransferase family 1 protein n=1 Tax=Cylindrospermopsis curvispora GIHE-G1 TaxID=2666332 RepID=A0A7H0F1J4_9CYAN|nr:glycosyltransferase [Cylindrospermopsis curvispora]QNP29910.1 glycosyltransferase family 1 protein [Cylindrospermopsis curvispora GIHE-G1]